MCAERGRAAPTLLTLVWTNPGWRSYSAKRSRHRSELVNRVLPDFANADLEMKTVELLCRQCSHRPRVSSKALRQQADAARVARRDVIYC